MAPEETQQVTHMNPRIEKDRQSIMTAHQKGTGAIIKTYLRLSGPGWLQSGITVGGVSFSSSLYLGVLVGFSMMWLQPVAMILGIIMLGAIAYVTLSVRERPRISSGLCRNTHSERVHFSKISFHPS
jgi:hypothetical protein